MKFPSKTSKKLFPPCKFLYFLASFPLGGLNAFTVEIKHQNQAYFLNFSTLFKSSKKTLNPYSNEPLSTSNSLQIPLKIPNNHWSVVILDLASFLSNYFEIYDEDWTMSSIKLCANMAVKTVMSSCKLFCLEEFPMEIRFKLNKGESFLEIYNYLLISEDQDKENVLLPLNKKVMNNKENINKSNDVVSKDINELKTFKKTNEIMKQRARSISNNNNKINNNEPNANNKITRIENLEKPKKKRVSFKLPDLNSDNNNNNILPFNKDKAIINLHDIPSIMEPPKPMAHEYQLINEIPFELTPNPIMTLQHIHGYSGLSKSLKSHSTNKILYSLGPNVISYDLITNKQSYFFQRNTNNSEIQCFAYCLENKFLITSTNQSLIQFWDLNTNELLPQSFQSSIRKLKTLNLVYDPKINSQKKTRKFKLFLTGDDEHQRVSIQVLDYHPQNETIQLFHKQISDWEITHFNPINIYDSSKGFLSLGPRNLRLWKLTRLSENYVLQGSNLNISSEFYSNLSISLTDFKVIPLIKSNTDNEPEDKDIINIIVSATNGFIYILSLSAKVPLAVFRLGSTAIVSLAYCPIRSLVASAFDDASLTIWKADFTSSILEGKLESQANSIEFIPSGLLTGCLNGSIGVISLEDQKYKTMIRSHTDEIIGLEYNNFLKKIVTISKDSTVRLWGLKGRSGFIEESYEFRCFDEEVCKIQSFFNEALIICGFKGGLIRMFNLKNYSIQCELIRHKSEITSLAIDHEDKFLLVIEKQLPMLFLYMMNEKAIGLDEIKTIKLRSLLSPEEKEHRCSGGFDKKGDYFYILNDSGYTLEIFSMRSLELLYSLTLSKEASNVIFSKFPNHIFLLTTEGSLHRYVIRKDTLTLFREYPSLHNGEVTSWQISRNSCFSLSFGEDRLIKVWDYNLRGYLTPYFQSFSAGEKMGDLRFSDDENGMVFGFGKESKGIYVWKFEKGLMEEDEEMGGYFGEMYGDNGGEKNNANGLMEMKKFVTTVIKEENDKNYMEMDKNNNYSNANANDNNDMMVKNGLSKNMMKNDVQKLKNESKVWMGINEDEEAKNERMVKNEMIVENDQPKISKSLIKNDTNVKTNDYKTNDHNPDESQLYAINNNAESNDIPLLGRYLYWSAQLGFNTRIPKALQNIPIYSSLIWNTLYKYIAYLSGPMLLITYLQNSKTQKKITFDRDLLQIYQTPNQKSLVVVTETLEFFIYSAKTLQKLGNFSLLANSRLLFVAISPCNTYILTLNQLKTEKSPLINIYELCTCALISSSLIKEMTDSEICIAKWTQNLEIYIFDSSILQVWRLTNKRSLEYQTLVLPKHEETLQKYGNFSAIQFIELKDKNSLLETVMLIGSSKGSLYIIDSRTGALLCLLASVIQGPIYEIFINVGRLIMKSNNQNVYNWKLTKEILENLETLGDLLQNPAEILVLDSNILSITQGLRTECYSDDQMMAITKTGTLWLLDYEEMTTIKLFSSHLSDKNIIETLIHEDYLMRKLLVFSVSKDNSIKIWDLESLELMSEIINPRKECSCIAIHESFGLLISGFSDGTLGFFDYRNNINKGTSKISEEKIPLLSLKVLQKSLNNLLISLGNGDIYMGYLEIIEGKIRLDLGLILKGLEAPVLKLLANEEEELNEWLMMDCSGKITVWTRKDLSRIVKKTITNIHEIEVYLIDSYKRSHNEDNLNKIPLFEIKFTKQPNVYVSLSSNGMSLVVRNYREHVNLRMIELKIRGFCFSLNEKGNYLYVGGEKGIISMFDYNLGLEVDRVEGNGRANLETINVWERTGRSAVQIYDVDYKEIKPVLIAGSSNNIMIFSFV